MKKWKTILVTSILSAVTVSTLAADLSGDERQRLINEFAKSRDGLIQAVSGLSDEQLNYRPDAFSWSIAQCLEHIVLAEERLLPMILDGIRKGEGKASEAKTNNVTAAQIEDFLVGRTTKFLAPDFVQPKGRWKSVAQALQDFDDNRRPTLALIDSSSLDRGSFVAPNPAFGELDVYQWLVFAAAHTLRHTVQINEVKARPGFPRM